MSTTPSLSLKSFFTVSAPNSTTTSTVLPSTKQDVAKAEALPPRQGASLSCTSISCLMLPIAYRQIISLHQKAPDQQDIEEWERARVNLQLRWCKLYLAVSPTYSFSMHLMSLFLLSVVSSRGLSTFFCLCLVEPSIHAFRTPPNRQVTDRRIGTQTW